MITFFKAGKRHLISVKKYEGLCAIFVFMLSASYCLAGMNVPLLIGTDQPAYDERGRVLAGSANATLSEPGDLVQILLVGEGIKPPLAGGTPDPVNILIAECQIGNLTSFAVDDSGAFACDLTGYSSDICGKSVFVRIFNAASMKEASFYGDSLPVVIDSDSVVIQPPKVDCELYTQDTDCDLLSDSWEMSYGTDLTQKDSDGDGMTDYEEVSCGSDPLNSASVFAMTGVINDKLELYWPSAKGVEYILQYSDTLGTNAAWSTIAMVTGQAGRTGISVDDTSSINGYYRIKVRL